MFRLNMIRKLLVISTLLVSCKFLLAEEIDDSVGVNEPVVELYTHSPLRTIIQRQYFDSTATRLHTLHTGNAVCEIRESLGQHGQAGRSIKLNERQYKLNSPFVQQHDYYFFSKDDAFIYNARKPYTTLQYTSSSKKEQHVNFYHTQNVNPSFNIGFRVNFFNSEGHYTHSKYSGKSLQAYANYKGGKNRSFFKLNFNQHYQEENGGLADFSFVTDSLHIKPLEYTVNLFTGESRVDYYDMSLMQEWNLLKEYTTLDSLLGDVNQFKLFLGHQFSYEYSAHRYDDLLADTTVFDFYTNKPFDSLYANDHAVSRVLSEDVFVGFNKRFSKQVRFGARAGYGVEFEEYSYNDLNFENPERFFQNQFFTISGHGRFGGKIDWELTNKQYVDGYKAGSFVQNGMFLSYYRFFNDTLWSTLKLTNEIVTPHLYYSEYVSQFFNWKNSFDNQTLQSVDVAVNNQNGAFGVVAYTGVRSNYIYFDENAVPKQLSDPFTELMLSGYYKLTLGSFVFKPKLTWQSISTKQISIPELISENQIYVSTAAFKKKLKIITGIDVSITSEYLSSSYMPSTGAFYQEYDNAIGLFPYTDFFLNLQLKRMRLLFKYSQLAQVVENYAGEGLQYLKNAPSTVTDYAFGKPRFTMGISWHFFK